MSSPASPLFRAWLAETNQSYRAVATLVGFDHTTLARVANGQRKPGRRLALEIEKLTRKWPRGAISAASWDEPVAKKGAKSCA